MAFRLKYVKDDTKIDFMRWHKWAFAVSGAIILLTFGLLFTRGLNYGIDFTGGVLMEIKGPETMHVDDVRRALADLSEGAPMIQTSDDGSFLIRIPGKETDTAAQKALHKEVEDALGGNIDFRRVEYVGPQVGKELIITGIKAFVYSMIGIMLYIWLRYDWRFGIAGIISLAHDVIYTLLFFLLTGVEFDLATVAAILLVAGYSVNDTVIVFDRIREKMAKYRQMPLFELINIAVNETLSRTLVTSSTTLLVMIILALFGNTVIQGFVCAMIVGIIVGTFSSVYMAAATLPYLGVRKDVEKAPAANGNNTGKKALSA
jgi:preprotein translocase SecF subunit